MFVLLFVPLIVTSQELIVVEHDDEDIPSLSKDYGDEKHLWGKETGVHWCDPPVVNLSIGDRFTPVRDTIIDVNSKGQYATGTMVEVKCGGERQVRLHELLVLPMKFAFFSCTLNVTTRLCEWTLVGLEDFTSAVPSCTFDDANIVVCDQPLQLTQHGISFNKPSRFYLVDDVITLLCSVEGEVLIPAGEHIMQCAASGWVHKINGTVARSASSAPQCVRRTSCTLADIPKHLRVAANAPHCEGNRCDSPSSPLSVGFQVKLECREKTMRLIGEPKVVCGRSRFGVGDAWRIARWPTCSPKLRCVAPYIRLGDVVPGTSRVFRWGSRITFDCFEGHSLVGPSILECTDSGSWNDTFPSCVLEEGEVNEPLLFGILLATAGLLLCVLVVLILLVRLQSERIKWKPVAVQQTVPSTPRTSTRVTCF